MPPGQQTLEGPASEAGTRSCRIVPIHPEEATSTLAHARAVNQTGWQTLGLDQAEEENPWQQDGGEA
jgi:hypothetical protein